MDFGDRLFRWCMFGAALIVAVVAIYFLATYMTASIAIGNGGLVRAMWLSFCAQLGFLALIFTFAGLRPHYVSRQFVMVLAVMPLLSTILLFWYAASRLGGFLLGVAAALVLIAAFTWPARPAPAPLTSPATRQVP